MSVKTRIAELNTRLANTLTDKGIEATADETTTALIDKVATIQTGGEYEDFYNTTTANGTNLSYLYCMRGGGLTEFPEHDYSIVKNMRATFMQTYITSIPELDLPEVTILGGQGAAGEWGAFQNCAKVTGNVKINCPKCTNFGYMFASFGNVDRIDIDTSNGTYFYSFLSDCKVKTIGTLDLRNASYTNYWIRRSTVETIEKLIVNGNPFNDVNQANPCNSLTNLTIEGSIKGNSHVYIASMPLSAESVKSVINAVDDISGTDKEGTLSIKFSSIAIENIEAEGATAPNGDTWLNYLLSKGWTY